MVLEEQARGELADRRAALKEGDTVTGTVRTLMPYGAFVDIGGADGLLHISDISRARVAKPEDVLSVGQELHAAHPQNRSRNQENLSRPQAAPGRPLEDGARPLQPGQRVSGTVTRLTDFGAFVEIEPGLEGLIHISEMSWAKKLRHPSDMLKQGDRVDAVILSVKPEESGIALGLKQALADPWLEVERKFPVGSQVEGPVTKLMNFGAFVQIAEGVDGLVHISEIVADRRFNHPRDVLREGQIVKAQVLAIDTEKRQIKLSMKQLIPTSIDEYIAEHKVGDTVSGRVVDSRPPAQSSNLAKASGPLAVGAARAAPQNAAAPSSVAQPAAHRSARPLFAFLNVEGSLERQRTRAIGPARAARRKPNPHLQNCEAGRRSEED